MDVSIDLDSIKDFKKRMESAIDKEVNKQNVKSESELELPRQNAKKYGKLEVVKLSGVGFTEEGELTKTFFFENLDAANQQYDDIMLTKEEAAKLSMSYRRLSTGKNASVPLRCSGELCPFRNDCVYFEIGKAPVGKQCKIEYDMLNYHTIRYIKQFDISPENHSDIMLIQELSEITIYESRLAKILGGWVPEAIGDDKQSFAKMLMGQKISYSKEGDEIKENTQHWAMTAMETLKNRKMKILDALMGTPKSKGKKVDERENETYADSLAEIKSILKKARADEVDAEIIEDNVR